MLNIVRDKILPNLNIKFTTLPQLEFIKMINIINGKSEHSQKSNPNIISDKNDQKQSGNLAVVTLRRVHKLVSNVIYFTCLHLEWLLVSFVSAIGINTPPLLL